MSLAKHVVKRLTGLGVTVVAHDERLEVDYEGEPRTIRLEPEWNDAFSAYKKLKSASYSASNQSVIVNTSIEVPLVRLDPNGFRDPLYEFKGVDGSSVIVSKASTNYCFSHFDSDDYEAYFERFIKRRLKTNIRRHVSFLFRSPITALYRVKGKKVPSNLEAVAGQKIKSCLFRLAVDQGDCFDVYKPQKKRVGMLLGEALVEDFSIPQVNYEENSVNYYKVAKSSPFPSQSFLAYYHVLEYYFLRVSEDALHHQLSALVNEPRFKSNSAGLDKVISLVRKQAASDDETEMLRKVISRFISEDDLIVHILDLEKRAGEKLYTKRRMIFGESLEISAREGHAISNSAKLLKHIRNAIVHSSDKYRRDECHIPLTETEHLIAEFIPLLKFVAEKVIYGTAEPQQL